MDDTEFESRQEKEIAVFHITPTISVRSTGVPICMFRVSFQKAVEA
jgi:hypothetical protein